MILTLTTLDAAVMLLKPSDLMQIFLDNRNHFTVESNNAAQLVASAARNIESLLLKRGKALEVSIGQPQMVIH